MIWQQARLLLLGVGVAILGWRSFLELFDQHTALPLPAVVVVAPIAAVVAVVLHRIPLTSPLPSDRETDVIVALSLLVLGGWLVASPPGRLGAEFWLWRPDLIGVALAALAAAALLNGTRFALWAAAPLVAAALVSTPGLQVLIAGLPAQPARAAGAAALLASAPLLVARPLDRRSFATRVVLALATALAGTVIGAFLSINVAVTIASVLAVVVIEAAVLRGGVRKGQSANPRRAPGIGAIASLAAAVAIVALAETWVPVAASAVPTASRLAAPTGTVLGAYRIAHGVSVVEWRLQQRTLPQNRALIGVAITGPTAATLLMYPTGAVVSFPTSPCPNTRTVRIKGRRVVVTEYLDWNNGYRWVVYSWAWRAAGRAQRVDLIAADGPAGAPVPVPAVTPSAFTDAVRTLGGFVAGRHPQCGLTSTPEDITLRAAALQVIGR